MSVRPRIRLQRSFDQRSHTYQGFTLVVDGEIGGKAGLFTVGIGKATEARFSFCAGDIVEGSCLPVSHLDLESVGYYQASGLAIIKKSSSDYSAGPPWHGIPPSLETYRSRGHRRLSQKSIEESCSTCIWAAHMAVEMIIDQWDSSNVRYRRESFCYGPKSCRLYVAGPVRRVPGRKGMVWVEEDWVDEQETEHRGPDE